MFLLDFPQTGALLAPRSVTLLKPDQQLFSDGRSSRQTEVNVSGLRQNSDTRRQDAESLYGFLLTDRSGSVFGAAGYVSCYVSDVAHLPFLSPPN